MNTKINEKEYLSLKEIEKLEKEIQKQKLKVSEENLKLVRMEYKALSFGIYDNIKELFIKRAHAGLQYSYAYNDFETALYYDKFKKQARKNMRNL